MKKEFSPNFGTPSDELSKEELNKLNSRGLEGDLYRQFRDQSKDDVTWETEQIAKSHGIYLEFDRAKTGSEKSWMYMVRVTIPGGGPINREQWRVIDELSDRYTRGPREAQSIRLTTRQNIQFHWIRKEDLVGVVRTIAQAGFFTLNACGDNVRNVMACPLSRFSDVYDANEWARKTGRYFQLPAAPHIKVFEIDTDYLRQEGEQRFRYAANLLNRKFKIAFAGVTENPETGEIVPDNCVEALTNDIAVVPLIEGGQVERFQIFIGGGQGERNGKPTMATLAQPLAVVGEDTLLETLDAIVQVHQSWGDRQNRHWARLKYLVKAKGTEWFRAQVQETLGCSLQHPLANLDCGRRLLHHGWCVQRQGDLLCYGAYIENGRLTDESPNGRLKSMVRTLVERYPTELLITPNQDLLFSHVPGSARDEFEADLRSFGYGERHGKPYSRLRLASGACVGRDTCRLTYTDSEKFEPLLLDELEAAGWGDVSDSIGITGCERQCFRPATKSIGLIGTGFNRYQFKLMGTEDGRHQGVPVLSSDRTLVYLRSVAREKVGVVIDALFRNWKQHRREGEDLGHFHRRIGMEAIISYLSEDEKTAELMEKPAKAENLLYEENRDAGAPELRTAAGR